MLDQLDEAIRSVLADIAATAPLPDDVSLEAPLRGHPRARWLLPAVAAAIVALVVGLVVVNNRETSTHVSRPASTALPSSTTVATTQLDVGGVPTRYPTVVARVISPAGGATVFRIDHGSSDGIQVGMAVANADGLVGKVASVEEGTSEVRLVTDAAYAVECEIDGAAVTCRGDGASVDLVPVPHAPLSGGATGGVTTSGGATSLAPPGIVVGRWSETSGHIELAADLAHLNVVSVIRYVPPNAVPG